MTFSVVDRKIINKIFLQQGSSHVNLVTFSLPKTDGGVDLSSCKFFISIVDGQGYDKIPVPFTVKDDTINVQWDIGTRTTSVEGNHPFQLLAENLEREVVWLTNTSHVIVQESLNVDDPISGFLPSVLQDYQARMDNLESQAENTLDHVQEEAETFISDILSDAVETLEKEGTTQISTIQEEGANQVAAAKEQVELATQQAGQAQISAEKSQQTASNLYELLPTVTVSGEGQISFPNCASFPLRNCTIYGAHHQEGTPTPEAPVTPIFTGSNGTLTVSISEAESQTVLLSRPLMGPEDDINLLSGTGKTVWKELELTGTEGWLKSGKVSSGGTVFYSALSGQDTQFVDKDILCTHFQKAKSVSSLVPGDIWMYNSTFIAVPNDLLGITESDSNTQKENKFKNWLSSEKEAGRTVTVWYPTVETQSMEISPINLSSCKGATTLTVAGADGEPYPTIQATAVQDWTLLKEAQQAKNQNYEERLNALETSTFDALLACQSNMEGPERARQARVLMVQTAQALPDDQAVKVPSLFLQWEPDISYPQGSRCNYNGIMYKCLQTHISQVGWAPDIATSLWASIDPSHSGTQDDPIPATLPMQYFSGKYYIENSTLYLCIRDSQLPMSYLPSQLIEQYFLVVS